MKEAHREYDRLLVFLFFSPLINNHSNIYSQSNNRKRHHQYVFIKFVRISFLNVYGRKYRCFF